MGNKGKTVSEVVLTLTKEILTAQKKAGCSIGERAIVDEGINYPAYGLFKLSVMVSPAFYKALSCDGSKIIEEVVDFKVDPATIHELPMHIEHHQVEPYRLLVR